MYYVMSDIHGCYDEMIEALSYWDRYSEHLVIMGDLIDRGPDSLKVIQYLIKLQGDNPDNVTILMGNHEEMFLAWLTNVPVELLGEYYNELHSETLLSFFGDKLRYQKSTRKQRGKHVLYNFKYELNWLMRLPYSFETDNIIFVHAGIDLNADDWRANLDDMLWVRDNFFRSSIIPDKRVFFGHTPTRFINPDESNGVWMSDDKMKVGIDGGVCFDGQLNALKVNESGDIVEVFNFHKKEHAD